MALVLADRVKETTSTSGTTDFVLSGAATGFQTFSAGVGANNTTYYAIADGADWEIGLGTLSSDGLTLARTTVLQSSNSDAKVSFSSSSKQIFVTYPADKAVLTDATQTLTNKTLNSPTFVTPVLGTPSSGTVTNLTGTASININGTVGATTANTGNFTTLTSSSTVTHNGGTANGVTYLNGSKVLTSGSALTFDGTTFALTGGLISASKGSANGITIGDVSTNSNSVLRMQGTSAGYNFQLANNLNVGGFELTPSTATGGVTYTTPVYSVTGLGVHAWSAGGSEAMRLTSTGLGIGTSSPATKVHAYSTTTMGQMTVDGAGPVKTGINFASGGTTYGQIYFDNNAPYDMSVFQQYSTGSLRFATNNTERARIDSDGNLLVGTTSASQSSGVGCKVLPNGTLYSVINSGADAISVYYSAVGYKFYVNSSGVVYSTSTSISAISDIRFKENVRDLDAGLTEVMALKPRLYDWKEGKGANIKNARGFIAQEFEEVFPDLIDEWKDPSPEGEAPYKSVRQDLIPILVKAIQEQQAIIQSLTERLDAANL
jgi:hypothetical protein